MRYSALQVRFFSSWSGSIRSAQGLSRSNGSRKLLLHLKAFVMREYYRIPLFYLALGLAWIFFSDRILGWIVSDPQLLTQIQTVKGMAYVLSSSLLLLFLTRSEFRKSRNSVTKRIAVFNSMVDGAHHILGNYLNVRREMKMRLFALLSIGLLILSGCETTKVEISSGVMAPQIYSGEGGNYIPKPITLFPAPVIEDDSGKAITGIVVAAVDVDEAGEAVFIKVLRSDHRMLEGPTVRLIRKFRFEPPIVDEVPTRITYIQEVRFTDKTPIE